MKNQKITQNTWEKPCNYITLKLVFKNSKQLVNLCDSKSNIFSHRQKFGEKILYIQEKFLCHYFIVTLCNVNSYLKSINDKNRFIFI